MNKWEPWYKNLDKIELYGSPITYQLAADFFQDVNMVEDWGCGCGGFREFCPTNYKGIEGTKNKFVDQIADLCTYTSRAEGILIRHVLEHNYDWEKILTNAIRSFTKKLCLIIFTPFSEKTREINFNRQLSVPDISFCQNDLIKHFAHLKWELVKDIDGSFTQYSTEHIFYIEK